MTRPGAHPPEVIERWQAAVEQVVFTPPALREKTMTADEAVEWLQCSPQLLQTLTAAGLPVVEDGPYAEVRYDTYDVINVGLAAGFGMSTAELGQRSMLRYSGDDPATWIRPRDWSVTSVYVCDQGADCVDGSWQVGEPACEVFGGTLKSFSVQAPSAGGVVSGPEVTLRTEFTGVGSVRTVVAPQIRDVYEDALESLRSQWLRYQWLPTGLRQDPDLAVAHGVVDCMALSLVTAANLERAGYQARTRTVTTVALVGIDHAWTEALDDDGEWKVLDPIFAHLALGTRRTRPEYRDFCCGSVPSRMLPWQRTAAEGVLSHRCAAGPSSPTGSIRTAVLESGR